MTSAFRRLVLTNPAVWVTALLATTGTALYLILVPAFLPANNNLPIAQEAREHLEVYLGDYAQQLDTYQAALQSGNGAALARADSFLSGHRQQFAQVLGAYLTVLARLPEDREPLVVKLQTLAPDERFQFAVVSLEGKSHLVQVSVAENDFDVRHLTLWLSKDEVLALNNYETEWQAQVRAVRFVTSAGQKFLIANGQTQQLEDQAPFLKVYQRVGSNLLDKTRTYLPSGMLDAFGSSEFIGQTANLKLDALLLDPEGIMAACDSCGLVGQRSLWQWTAKGYQAVDQQILNEPGNALYAALVVLVRREGAGAWTKPFLAPQVQATIERFKGFDPKRYPAVEQGLVVTASQPWQKTGFEYSIEGPTQLKVYVKPNAQGQWRAVEVRDLKLQPPGWSVPYVRDREVVAG
ncbi:hypothetical protein [Anthocerotibacter panamensis]|uniref:hypothetical protein n=1 Tax=Anthocerotibacter panamensis TaxID=2857077 RepID=UPI001C406E0B|nr:hypothetical protein [Anthocerotibacter panamensis]